MIESVLELAGLSSGQAGIGVAMILFAIWARRAILAGAIVATGLRFAVVVAVAVGLGIVSGVIAVDLSALFGIVGEFGMLLKTLLEFTIGPFGDLIERVVSKVAVLLAGLRSSQPAPASMPARSRRRAETRRRTPARASMRRGGTACEHRRDHGDATAAADAPGGASA